VTTRRTLFWHSVMPRTVEESTTLAIDAGGQVGTGAREARWRTPYRAGSVQPHIRDFSQSCQPGHLG